MTTHIALVGFSLEANSLAEPTRRSDGVDVRKIEGGIRQFWESRPCVDELRARLGVVEFSEGPYWMFPPGGPLLRDDFNRIIAETREELSGMARIDAVVVFGHGAAITVDGADADGPFLATVRECVGADVPIVCILDFHANLSATMVTAVDAIVAYRTNPHVDVADCAREAAAVLCTLLEGTRTVRAWCRLPMRVPQIAQLTRDGEPFGVAAERARVLQGENAHDILNISVLGGFSLADTTDALSAIVVTARESRREVATEVARDVAQSLWDERVNCRTRTTPIEVAVSRVAGNSDRWILSDGSDNPGGGAPGNTVHLIAALLDAGVDGVHSAVHIDPQLVDQAWAVGVGRVIHAEFNKSIATDLTGRLVVDAEVLSLADGAYVPAAGVYAGATLSVGRACALRVGNAVVGVGSRKVQCADPDTMRHVGCDPDHARVIVVKSRGHFRAGFEGFVRDDHIIEVGAPGVSTNDLQSVTWHHAPTNVFPFTDEVEWDGMIFMEGSGNV